MSEGDTVVCFLVVVALDRKYAKGWSVFVAAVRCRCARVCISLASVVYGVDSTSAYTKCQCTRGVARWEAQPTWYRFVNGRHKGNAHVHNDR